VIEIPISPNKNKEKIQSTRDLAVRHQQQGLVIAPIKMYDIVAFYTPQLSNLI
jgi:hypothetical protein